MRRPKVNGRVPFKSGTEEQDAPVLHLTAKYIQIKTGRLTVGNRVDQSVGQHKTNTSSPVQLQEFPLSLRQTSTVLQLHGGLWSYGMDSMDHLKFFVNLS